MQDSCTSIAMFSVVNAADGFAPQQVGKALASLWAINGLTMKLESLHSSSLICPFTLDKISNAGMTADGHVYQMGFIMDWLRSNSSSPMTNLASHFLKNASYVFGGSTFVRY